LYSFFAAVLGSEQEELTLSSGHLYNQSRNTDMVPTLLY